MRYESYFYPSNLTEGAHDMTDLIIFMKAELDELKSMRDDGIECEIKSYEEPIIFWTQDEKLAKKYCMKEVP